MYLCQGARRVLCSANLLEFGSCVAAVQHKCTPQSTLLMQCTSQPRIAIIAAGLWRWGSGPATGCRCIYSTIPFLNCKQFLQLACGVGVQRQRPDAAPCRLHIRTPHLRRRGGQTRVQPGITHCGHSLRNSKAHWKRAVAVSLSRGMQCTFTGHAMHIHACIMQHYTSCCQQVHHTLTTR